MGFDVAGFSLKVRNYKCFGADLQGFDRILPMNIIIGRNNSGKTALLEVVHYATAPSSSLAQRGHDGQLPEVVQSYVLDEQVWSLPPFEVNTDGFLSKHFARRYFSGKRLTWFAKADGSKSFISIEQPGDLSESQASDAAKEYLRLMGHPFATLKFRRLAADRDIKWESSPANGSQLDIHADGEGATSAVEQYLNRDFHKSELIESTVLDAMNRIFSPDTTFSRILVQLSQPGGGRWEINLEQPGKGRIPMHHTGSGVKTVLLVLLFIYIVPEIDKKPLAEFLFAFEELENNLHPAVQRRLFLFLRETSIANGCKFFVTTHSNAVIDLFRDDDKAQIIHVEHDGKESRAVTVSEHLHRCRVLDDLGVRASDVLQANAIVWVEGPSDRLYFNRWAELFSDGQLRDGVHYLCLIYGGSILANYSFDDPECAEQLIAALRVNRHAIVLIDSDKQNAAFPLKERAARVAQEARNSAGIGWVTAGREVENYIPDSAFRAINEGVDVGMPKRYADVFAFLEKHRLGKFRDRKPELAKRVCKCLTLGDLRKSLDLAERMAEVCTRIRDWNGMS